MSETKITKCNPVIEVLIFVGLIATTAILFLNYDFIADKVPVHWNVKGEADWFVEKQWLFIGPVIGLINYIIISFVNRMAISNTLAKFSETDSEVSLKMKKMVGKLGLINMILVFTPLVIVLFILYIPEQNIFTFLVLLLLLTVILSLILGKQISDLFFNQEEGEVKEHKILNFFMAYDVDNPKVIVPKKVGVGQTINIATTGGKILFFFLAIIPVIFILIAIL